MRGVLVEHLSDPRTPLPSVSVIPTGTSGGEKVAKKKKDVCQKENQSAEKM